MYLQTSGKAMLTTATLFALPSLATIMLDCGHRSVCILGQARRTAIGSRFGRGFFHRLPLPALGCESLYPSPRRRTSQPRG